MKNQHVIISLLLSATLVACGSNGNSEKEASAFIERSAAYEQQGQYRAAMIEMRNAIQAAPNDINNLMHYAEILMKIGALRQAAQLLEPIEGTQHLVLLADIYAQIGKHVSANETLAKATQDSYRASDIPLLQAKIDFLNGKQSSALADLRSIAGSSGNNQEAIKELITLLIASEKYSEANDWTKQSLAASVSDPDFLYFSAQLAYFNNDLEAAEKQLTDALLNLPDTDMLIGSKLRTIELLAKVLSDLGRTTEALVYSRVLQDANPEAFSARQQYQDAIQAAAQGDLTTAKGAFQDILVQFPNNQQAALLLGLVNLEQGNLEEGELLLSENLDAETAPISLIQATALAQAEMGKTATALGVVERALLARPDDPTLLSLFGVISLNSDKPAQGIEALSKALQLEPGRSRLHLLLAQHYNRSEQPEMALGHLRKAYSVNPTDWATTSYYISTLFAQNETTEAIKVRDDLKSKYKNQVTPQWLAALIDYRRGDLQLAKTQLAALITSAGNVNEIVTSYAALLDQLEEYNEAANVWLTALNNDPGERRYMERAVRSKTLGTNRQETISWLDKNKVSYPEATLPIDAGLVQLYVMQNQIDKALAIGNAYRNNQQPMAKQLQVAALQGKVLERANEQQFADALNYANQALKIQPFNQQLTVLAAQFESRTESKEVALKRLTNFINANNDADLVISEKATLLSLMEGDQAAYDFIQPYWAEKPRGDIATVYLALTKKVVSVRFEDAVDELLKAEPNNAGGNVIKGDLVLAKGDEQGAAKYYLAALQTNSRLVPALNNLAWILAKQDPKEALRYSASAADLAPSNAAVLDTHGWIQYLAGDKKSAIQTLEKANKLDPANQEIKDHLTQARK